MALTAELKLEPFQNESEFIRFERRYRPDFETTFPYTRSDFEKCVEKNREWVEWAGDLALMNKEHYYAVSSSYTFMSYFFCFCPDIERYETIVKMNLNIFIWDDHSENCFGHISRNFTRGVSIWRQFDEALDKLQGEEYVSMAHWKPFAFGIYSAWENIYETYDEVQKRRFITVWRYYSWGNLEECSIFEAGRVFKDVEEDIRIRRKTISVIPFIQQFEYTQGIYLKEEEWDNKLMQKLLILTVDCMIWCNDAWSFEKEFRELDYKMDKLQCLNNVVSILAGMHGGDIDKAMSIAMVRNSELEKETKAVADEILSKPGVSDAVRHIIKCIEYSIGSNWISSTILDRYNKLLDQLPTQEIRGIETEGIEKA